MLSAPHESPCEWSSGIRALVALGATHYRNFSVCPHCTKQAKEDVLWRVSEGFPMISRSDGETYHLLLADHPRVFPAELSFSTSGVSLCFMYENLATGNVTQVALVVIFGKADCPRLTYRQIEELADLLAANLMESSGLPSFQMLGAEL